MNALNDTATRQVGNGVMMPGGLVLEIWKDRNGMGHLFRPEYRRGIGFLTEYEDYFVVRHPPDEPYQPEGDNPARPIEDDRDGVWFHNEANNYVVWMARWMPADEEEAEPAETSTRAQPRVSVTLATSLALAVFMTWMVMWILIQVISAILQ